MIGKISLAILATLFLLPFLNLVLGIRPFTFKTPDDPQRRGLRHERVSFPTEDGLTLRGWFIPAAGATQRGQGRRLPTIIAGHGYPADKANILGHVLFLHPRFNLLLFDFRYFGESEGTYTTAGILETRDARAAVDYLLRRGDVDGERIGAIGFSMSAAAFLMARSPKIKAIVAESPYATLSDLIEGQFGFLPALIRPPLANLTALYARLLLGVRVSEGAPVEAVRDLKTPLLIIHGETDSQIPVRHAHRIAASADPATTEIWIVPNADHGMPHALQPKEYEERVLNFFERHLSSPPLTGPP